MSFLEPLFGFEERCISDADIFHLVPCSGAFLLNFWFHHCQQLKITGGDLSIAYAHNIADYPIATPVSISRTRAASLRAKKSMDRLHEVGVSQPRRV